MVEGWTNRRLGDFSEKIRDINESGALLEPLSVTKGQGVVLQSSRFSKQIATDLKKYQIARRGDFVFDPMSLYYGAIGRLDVIDRGAVSPDYVVFGVDSSVDSEFFLALMRSSRMCKRFESLSEVGNRTGKRRRLYWSGFREINIPMPPHAEQRKIAAILSSVDEAIEKTQAVIDQVQVVKKGLMQELLTKGLPGRHQALKQTDFGHMPIDWTAVQLNDLVSPDRPICYGILKPGKGVPGGVPVIKVKNIRDGAVDDSNLLLTSQEIDHEFRRSRLRGGDVLLSIRGTVGRLAVVPQHLSGANITQDTARISIDDPTDRDYVFAVLQSDALQRQMNDRVIGQAVKGINIRDVRLLTLPFPREREERKTLARVLQSVDEHNAALILKLSGLKTLKFALSTLLLTGELRVRPTPEPA